MAPDDRGDSGRQGPVFYGRRRGKKLRRRGQTLIAELLPRLAIPEPAPGQQVLPGALFPESRAVWLEVGFGGGEHLAALAEANPDVGMIGCEVFVNGIASLLRHVEERRLGNLRIFPGDARRLFPALPDACLEKLFVMFPDPWPKARHAERRFIAPANLDVLARLLADGGELRVASDDAGYVAWSIEHLTAHPLFVPSGAGFPATARPAGWPPTRYEGKALAQGRPCTYLSYRRVGRG